jgi:hypothetical protein
MEEQALLDNGGTGLTREQRSLRSNFINVKAFHITQVTHLMKKYWRNRPLHDNGGTGLYMTMAEQTLLDNGGTGSYLTMMEQALT